MSRIKHRVLLSFAAIGFLGFTLLASAQEQHFKECKDQPDQAQCNATQMEKMQAAHAAKLHDALKITAEQEPAWKTFNDSVHPPGAMPPAAKPTHADMEKMSAPEIMEQHLAWQQKHLTEMQSHLAALKTFYTVLTPTQQTILNSHFAHMMQHHRDWHHHHDDNDHAPAAK